MYSKDFSKIIHNGNEMSKVYHTNKEIWSSVPGPSILVAGDLEAGFYGEVPSNKLINGDELASLVGLQVGVSVNTLTNWLKFSFENKILFVPKKPIRHTISANQLASLDLINGNKTVTIGDYNYKVRLLKGANNNPVTGATLEHVSNSEWDRLILPLSDKAPDKFDTKRTSMPTANFGTNFTDTELGAANPDRHTLCQETQSGNQFTRGYASIERAGITTKSYPAEVVGWRPVLELI